MDDLGVKKFFKRLRDQYQMQKMDFTYRIHTTFGKGKGSDVLRSIEADIRNKPLLISIIVENNIDQVVKAYTFYYDEDENGNILDTEHGTAQSNNE